MTERPIPFSAEMVRTILAGRKTQTRRKMKVQPYPDSIVTVEHFNQTVIDRHGDMQPGPEIFGALWGNGEYGLRCPYGAPGDLLWVREAWRAPSQYDDWPPSRIPPSVEAQYIADARAPWISRYRHARFMPRWASRITLEVESVRVERLQDITQKDAIAEGAPESHSDIDRISRRLGYQDFSRSWFAQKWGDIPGAWEANPWVWVIEFEKVKP
jgi:hypothetical protein